MRNEEDFETESLLSQSLCFKTFKIYLIAIFTHVVSKLCNNKKLRHWFKATLTLETRIVYICNTHGYQRGTLQWPCNEAYISIRWDTARWCAKNSCEKRDSNCFYLRSLIMIINEKSMIAKGHIQVCIRLHWSRMGSLRQFRWFALKYFVGLYVLQIFH